MKLPRSLLIGLTVVIFAVDALEISTTEPPKTIEGNYLVTGSSEHEITTTATKNPLEVKKYKRMCYYANSDQYRTGKGKFFPEDMDTSLCTHLIYNYANISDNFTVMPRYSNEDGPGGMYERFNNLKNNSNVVTLLDVFATNSDLVKMTNMLKTEATQQQFINSFMSFARQRNFDGLSLIFWYPGIGRSPPEDKERYTLLLREFRKAIVKEAYMTGKSKLFITALFSGTKYIIDNAYELNLVHQYLDFLMVMPNDLNDSGTVTKHYSALFPGNKTDKLNTVEGVTDYYVSKGVPSDKIVIGIRTRGRGYTLKNAYDNGLGAPVVGPSPAGEYTQEPGNLAYYEICTLLNDSSHVVYLEDEKVPYYHNDTLWISYDNQKSMVEKANFVKDKGYAGWYVWTTGFDDFDGTSCNQGPFPLIRALSDTLMGSVTGHLQPLTKILQSSTTLSQKKELTTTSK